MVDQSKRTFLKFSGLGLAAVTLPSSFLPDYLSPKDAEPVLEAALNSKNSLYKKNHTIKEAKSFLMKNEFKISKIEDVDKNIKNEKNIFFYKKKYSNQKQTNIKYNLRYYNRIISDRTNLKDKFINFLCKLF